MNIRTESVNATGMVTAQTVRTFDTLGRQTSYTDAGGAETTATYGLVPGPGTVADLRGTRTFGYDGGAERRGLATSLSDTRTGTFTASYDVEGNLVTETWPNGISVTTVVDEVGQTTSLTYSMPGCGQDNCTLYTENASYDANGKVASVASSLSSQDYGYDAVLRLTTVQDTVDSQCTTRAYGFDSATNRSSRVSYGPDVDGACQTAVASDTTNWTFDVSDRATGSDYASDGLGRSLSIPARDTAISGNGATSISYHVNDMVRSISQGGWTNTYTLDVDPKRIRSWTAVSGSSESFTNHYGDESDTPIATTGPSGTSFVFSGLGNIAGIHTTGMGDVWQIINLHGDFVAGVIGSGPGLSYTSEYMESGLPRNQADAGTRRYGWLGSSQRAADTPGGLTLMGSRLYAPGSGRFLSPDPVYGGSANAYEYGSGDAVGNTDVSGNGIDCSPSWRSGWFSSTDYGYGRIWQPYWTIRKRTIGFTTNIRCRLSHTTTVWALWAAGTVVAGALWRCCRRPAREPLRSRRTSLRAGGLSHRRHPRCAHRSRSAHLVQRALSA
jgi:RHS repeat-associated protein